MNYGTAENEIVARLTSHFEARNKSEFYEAAVFPETKKELDDWAANFIKARAAVQYNGSNYNPTKSTSIICQDETVSFRITFEARKLRGEGGIYSIIEECKLALIGWKLTNSDQISISKYGMLEYEQSVFQPYLEIECKTMNVQAFDVEENNLVNSLVKLEFANQFESQFTTEFNNDFN